MAKEYGHKIDLTTHNVGHQIDLAPKGEHGIDVACSKCYLVFYVLGRVTLPWVCKNCNEAPSAPVNTMLEDMEEQLRLLRVENTNLRSSLEYEVERRNEWMNRACNMNAEMGGLLHQLVEARMSAWEKVKRYLKHLWKDVL